MIKQVLRPTSERYSIREWCRDNIGPEGHRWWFGFDNFDKCEINFELDEDKEKFLTMFWIKWPSE